MAKAILESLDELPEELKGEYEEKTEGGKKVYVLKVEGIDSHPNVKGLKTALDKQKNDNKELKTKLSEAETKHKDVPEDFSIDEWQRLQALDIDENDPDAKAKRKAKEDERLATQKRNFEQQIASLNKKYETDTGDLRNKLTSSERRRAADQAEAQLVAAFNKAGVKPAFFNAAKALHLNHVKHELDDETGELEVFVETDLGKVSIEQFVDTWSKSDDGKEFIIPPTGGGADGKNRNGGGHGEVNPFSASTWNKTEQGRLILKDAAKADRMAKQAGFKSLDVAKAAARAITPAK